MAAPAEHLDYRITVSQGGTILQPSPTTRASAPASNQKLFTTITLLELVGPAFRYTTAVSGTATDLPRTAPCTAVSCCAAPATRP